MLKDELVKRVEDAKRLHRCPSESHCGAVGTETLAWVKKQESADDILQNMCLYNRLWCIRRGLDEFIEHSDWDDMDGYEWSYLLRGRPEFAERCDPCWDDLSGYDWRRLLERKPKFAKYCDWEKVTEYDWQHILGRQPQLAKYKALFPPRIP